MSSKYQYKDISVSATTSVTASSTTPISKEYSLSAQGSTQAFRVDVSCTAAVVGSGISLVVQEKQADDSWLALSGMSVAVTASGNYHIKALATTAAGQAIMPVRKVCRLALVTLAGASATVSTVTLLQEE